MNKIYYCSSIKLIKEYRINKLILRKKNFASSFSSSEFSKIIGLIVTPLTKISVSEILKMKNIKFIFIMGLHKLSNIDLLKLPKKIKILFFDKKKNKSVLNKISPTPEFIIGLICILARNLNFFYQNKKNLNLYNKFNNSYFFEKMISNATLGIIGYGRIGKKLAQYAIQFGMKVIVYAPNQKINNSKISKVFNLSSVATKSDFISINASLKKNNYNLIDKKFFEKMKKNSYFINTAKGDLINLEHLTNVIIKNKISGAAIDVYSKENENLIINNHKIALAQKEKKNLIFTPHIAGATKYDRLQLQNRMFYLIKKHLS